MKNDHQQFWRDHYGDNIEIVKNYIQNLLLKNNQVKKVAFMIKLNKKRVNNAFA